MLLPPAVDYVQSSKIDCHFSLHFLRVDVWFYTWNGTSLLLLWLSPWYIVDSTSLVSETAHLAIGCCSQLLCFTANYG